MIVKDDVGMSRKMMLGCGLILVGFCLIPVAILARSAAPMGLGVIALLVGIGVAGYTLYTGLKSERSSSGIMPMVHISECRVTARFFTNEMNEMLFNEEDLQEDEVAKYYVRLLTPDGKTWELKCYAESWRFCGEGMQGSADVQGDFMVRFTPLHLQRPPENASPY